VPSENTRFPVPLPAPSDALRASEQKMIRPVVVDAAGRLANAMPVDWKPLVEIIGPEKVVLAMRNSLSWQMSATPCDCQGSKSL